MNKRELQEAHEHIGAVREWLADGLDHEADWWAITSLDRAREIVGNMLSDNEED